MEYTITNVQQRGEWNFQGSTMVDYAIALEGQQGWIKLTQKLDTPPPQVGQTIFGQIENKTNTNGNAYKKFKKLNPNFAGNQGGGSSQSQGGQSNQKLDYIVQMLEELTGRREVKDTVVEPSETELEDPFAGLGI